VKEGYAKVRAVTREHAKTFYFASRFLPKDKRNAAYAIYAICRITDDTVDNDAIPSRSVNLRSIEEKIESVYRDTQLSDSSLLAFKETVNKYNIPRRYFDELIQGMYMDLNKSRYENFDELYTYCYRVAGVVGSIMLKIFGSHHQEAERYAIDLGIAMQLTNILRDIKEDFKRGRIYLPKDEMERFNMSENHISEEKVDESFIALLKCQIGRARDYYNSSAKGIKMINSMMSRFVVCIMKDIYAGILTSIENNGYDIFSHRAHVDTGKKLCGALKVVIGREYW